MRRPGVMCSISVIGSRGTMGYQGVISSIGATESCGAMGSYWYPWHNGQHLCNDECWCNGPFQCCS